MGGGFRGVWGGGGRLKGGEVDDGRRGVGVGMMMGGGWVGWGWVLAWGWGMVWVGWLGFGVEDFVL